MVFSFPVSCSVTYSVSHSLLCKAAACPIFKVAEDYNRGSVSFLESDTVHNISFTITQKVKQSP